MRMIWESAIQAGGFRRLRAGEQGRSLPPPAPQASLSLFPRNRNHYRLASRPATAGRFIGPRSPETADGSTTAANRSRPPRGREPQESHGNVPICYDHQLLEELPRRGRGYLRPPICPATFSDRPFAPILERHPEFRGAWTAVSVKSPIRPIRRSCSGAIRPRQQA
jgi:hypothetical protein